MNHKQKSLIFNFLDVFPARIGFFLYHKLQNIFSKDTIEYKIDSTKKSYETMESILKNNNFELSDKNVAEIGSGWIPILPYFFKFAGNTNSVKTYDINRHYNSAEILKLNRIFIERYNVFKTNFTTNFNLPESVQYFPNTDIANGNLDNIDLVFSRFVLEHVPPNILRDIHNKFAENLKKGSYILHLISPSDHRAYSDSSISMYDFLKYSQEEWNSIQTKFDYHNRLRLPQYISIFKEKFDVVSVSYESCKTGSAQHDKFKLLNIHDDFKMFTDEELTAGSINILLKVR